MFPTLGVSQIGPVILMNGQTQSTFEAANMVFEKVRVFIEIDSLKGKFAESLSSICVRG